jgi:LemA protein
VIYALIALVIGVIIIANFIIRTYADFIELKTLRDSCFGSLEGALIQRYNAMEEIINYSKGYIDDENRFIVKLLQIKMLPINQKLEVEKDLVSELKVLINEACDIPELASSKEFTELRIKLAKSEKAIYEALNVINTRSKDYNLKITDFPRSIVAKLAKVSKMPCYKIDFVTR